MYAHGKLLLTGEYFVLDGALALAMPVRFGQRMAVNPRAGYPFGLHWQSLTEDGQVWFAGDWQLVDGVPVLINATDSAVAERLQQIFLAIQAQNPSGLQQLFQAEVRVRLEFDRAWGLGSSSTLVSLLAQATKTDPYALLAVTFGGSGYDIACATAKEPIFYQRENDQSRSEPAAWDPAYAEHLYFAYLGQKQNSRDGIRYYRELGGTQPTLIDEVTELTRAFHAANTLTAAQEAAAAHEEFISNVLEMERIQTERFADFTGTVKSLGAWGGDFVMVLSDRSTRDTREYFTQRGCPVVLGYEEMKL